MSKEVGSKKCFLLGAKIADAINDLHNLVSLALWDDALKKIEELKQLKDAPDKCGIDLSMIFEYVNTLETEIKNEHYELAYYTMATIMDELHDKLKKLCKSQ